MIFGKLLLTVASFSSVAFGAFLQTRETTFPAGFQDSLLNIRKQYQAVDELATGFLASGTGATFPQGKAVLDKLNGVVDVVNAFTKVQQSAEYKFTEDEATVAEIYLWEQIASAQSALLHITLGKAQYNAVGLDNKTIRTAMGNAALYFNTIFSRSIGGNSGIIGLRPLTTNMYTVLAGDIYKTHADVFNYEDPNHSGPIN